MAPVVPSSQVSSAPLADYFFISGIETSQVYDKHAQSAAAAAPSLDTTIEEDVPAENEQTRSRRASLAGALIKLENRRSRHSSEARKSFGSIGGEDKFTTSNRSSATIKGVPAVGGASLNDADFEHALRKFASERDTFLEDIQFSTGSMAQVKTPKPRPKTQRIVNEDTGASNNIRSGVGTIKRRISTMSSMKRQPSIIRQSSIRTSRRMSGYNAVIPTPQPFQHDPNMHPLRRRYEPVLLDRYPPKDMVEELKRRNPFPDYVPMFAFPDDVRVVMADERPKSTWHGFSMTGADNSKLHGICLIVWLPLNTEAAAELETQCEAWRQANVSSEERELASSLGERLAADRATLSRLLAKLSTSSPGSDHREMLEEEICAVEERIGLMSELLRTFRYGASAKIEGLTDGDTGLWIPRAYGVLGRDGGMTSFWKEWLKAIVVPMMNGAVLRVPPSSPRIGMWQPLERYVVNLCAEAPSPMSSITQVELSVRELRLYARKEAANELPGSRNTDLYALFRSLTLPNIVTLFEYALAEARIILLSSHTAMLHLASAALVNLLYPVKWSGVFIPVLPARLIQALEAPCPYIVGVDKRYENWDLPDDDFVVVDLDNDTIESTAQPTPLPRQQRRKLLALLQLAAPLHRWGVPAGPPRYAQEAFPCDAFSSENPSIFTSKAPKSALATYVSLNSASFGTNGPVTNSPTLVFNAFLQARNDRSRGSDRPSTASTVKTNTTPPSPRSPASAVAPPLPSTPISRSDSAYALQANLREKRSGYFDTSSRRSLSLTFDRVPTRRPSQPFIGHSSNLSISTLSTDVRAPSSYAPSVYAHSTLAASTIMPGIMMQPVRDTDTTRWVEGHCLQWRASDERSSCFVCDEKSDDGLYNCSGCGMYSHARCSHLIDLVCPTAFRPDQVRAAFVRCFASLMYTYRRYLGAPNAQQKKSGLLYSFNVESFLRSLPHEQAEYMTMLQHTQSFNEFIHERESTRGDDPAIRLFDEIIISKKNRGRTSFFSKLSTQAFPLSRLSGWTSSPRNSPFSLQCSSKPVTSRPRPKASVLLAQSVLGAHELHANTPRGTAFLSDSSDHLWRSAAATPPNSRFPGDYRQVTSRIPAKLDPALMKEPRVIQGGPRVSQARAKRKPIPSMLAQFGQNLTDLPPSST